jgi:hypothetical protein
MWGRGCFFLAENSLLCGESWCFSLAGGFSFDGSEDVIIKKLRILQCIKRGTELILVRACMHRCKSVLHRECHTCCPAFWLACSTVIVRTTDQAVPACMLGGCMLGGSLTPSLQIRGQVFVYLRVCVCVCVCVYAAQTHAHTHARAQHIHTQTYRHTLIHFSMSMHEYYSSAEHIWAHA